MMFSGLAAQAFAQEMQVANFSYGKGKSYEHLSFWVENGQRSEIKYAYQKSRKNNTTPVAVNYGGKVARNGAAGFKIEFPNNLVLFVFPQKTFLKVTDGRGKNAKIFRWEYEGPTGGIGTWCDICTQDGGESAALVKKYFLR